MPILMLLYIMLCIVPAYLMLFAALSNAACLYGYVSLDVCAEESLNSLSLRFIKVNIHHGEYICVSNMSMKP